MADERNNLKFDNNNYWSVGNAMILILPSMIYV